jgi:hypothetical protein
MRYASMTTNDDYNMSLEFDALDNDLKAEIRRLAEKCGGLAMLRASRSGTAISTPTRIVRRDRLGRQRRPVRLQHRQGCLQS